MNLAFVGSEREWRRLERSLKADISRHIVRILPDPPVAWQAWPQPAQRVDSFDEVITDPQITGLILAGAVAERAERLRHAMRLGRHTLSRLPADPSAIFYHEIALMASDTNTVLVPWLDVRLHPIWQRLLSVARSEAFGPIQSVTIEWTGQVDDPTPLIAAAYAESADLLLSLLDDIVEVTAAGEAVSGRLIVHHRTHRGATAECRFTSQANRAEPNWSVVVEAAEAVAECSFAYDSPGELTLTPSDGTMGEPVTLDARPESHVLAEFARSIAGQPSLLRWSDAIRAAELADSVRISHERRRAVDVYHESRSELASFKGRMTSLGCGLIWLTLFAVIVVAAGKGLGIPGMDWLAAAAAVVWVVFLAMQGLRWVLPRDPR